MNFIVFRELSNIDEGNYPGNADRMAGEHHAPGSKADAHGCSSKGGQCSRAAAADVDDGTVTLAGGIFTPSIRGFSLSATFQKLSTTPNETKSPLLGGIL